MAWRSRYREYGRPFRERSREDEERHGWIYQVIFCLFIFFVLLGTRSVGQGLAGDILAFAKDSVEKDISYQDIKVWLSGAKDAVLKLPDLDIRNFWVKAVTGKPQELIWPVEGRVTSYFGWRPNPDGPGMSLHQGIDIEAPKGTKVVSVLDGIVKDIRNSPEYGNVVEIEHGQALTTLYGHLEEVLVTKGQKVKKGEAIGTVGETGNARGSHLHFELAKDGLEVDPMPLLPPNVKEP